MIDSSSARDGVLSVLCIEPMLAPRLEALIETPFGRIVLVAPDASADLAAVAQVAVVPAASAMALLEAIARDLAVVVVVPDADLAPQDLVDWIAHGAEDVLSPHEWDAPSLPRRLLAAAERKRVERAGRIAYATDLETGLPHERQLVEHMSQLLALREREPAPMAVLAIRVEGLASVEAQHGRAAANVVRRKLAVRLRAGVRGSDVVASVGDDMFAVLLGSVLTPADADRVGEKLLRALRDPFKVAGQGVVLAAALGIGRFPEDGNHPDILLRRATGLAASTQASGSARRDSANDDSHRAANDEH